MLKTESLETEDTRNKILRTALELFAKFGFDGVSTRRIAQEASCNIASLNYHFGTKKKLYYECLMIIEPKKNYELESLLKPPADKLEFKKSFKAFCITVAEFVVQNASSLKLLINEINADSQLVPRDPFLKPLTDKFESFLKEAKSRDIICPDIDVELFSKMVVSVILSQKLYKSFQTYQSISNEELADKIVKSSTSNFFGLT